MNARMARPLRRCALALMALLPTFGHSAGAEPGAARLVGPFTRDDYPQAIIDRPLTLPARMVEAEVGAQFTSLRYVTFANSGRVLPEVDLAAPTRWRLTDWLWLRAGENLFAATTADGMAHFAFDLGVGVQPHRLFAVTLDSRIASVAFDGGGHETS